MVCPLLAWAFVLPCVLGAGPADAFHEASLDLGLLLPVQPGNRELPLKGSWEASCELSLLALASVKDRPEIWAQRAVQMVNVEFVM